MGIGKAPTEENLNGNTLKQTGRRERVLFLSGGQGEKGQLSRSVLSMIIWEKHLCLSESSLLPKHTRFILNFSHCSLFLPAL